MGNRLSIKAGDVSIPFYASPESLPEDLPSLTEIETASLHSENLLDEKTRHKVVRVRTSFVVKYGSDTDVTFAEGRTLLYLERNREALPSLRFPRLYAMFTKENKTFLVMERLEGQPLSSSSSSSSNNSLWSTYSAAEKDAIATTLQHGIQELRRLPSPMEGQFCGVDGAPLPDILSWSPDRTQLLSGPFPTEEAWKDALLKMMKDYITPHRFKFIRDCVDKILTGCPPVFTHGDLQKKNILVHATTATPAKGNLSLPNGTTTKFQVSLVDWGNAGWYPSYWEYFVAIWTCHQMDDDFAVYLDSRILESYPVEWALCHELFETALSPAGTM